MTALNLNKVKFSDNSDVVNPGEEIYNPQYSNVNTFKGDDKIIGTSHINGDFALGSYVGVASKNSNAIASSYLKGKATVASYGIKNEGFINTNDGSDIVKGSAIANISATAETVSQAIAIAETRNATAIASAFASINVKATADGIDNSWGVLKTGEGSDSVSGNIEGSISAVAIAKLDASAIIEAICKASHSEGLTAFAKAMATSLAEGTITATGINNNKGVITTDTGDDTLSASATSSAGSFAGVYGSAYVNASADNQALAETVAKASALAIDKAIAIDNSKGWIDTGDGNDKIIAKATGLESYGIFGGDVDTGKGSDRIIASSFGGGVNIDLGEGNDFVQGFGDAEIDGGQGNDTLDLSSYNQDNFKISFGGFFSWNFNNSVSFRLDGVTLTTTGFEQFNFANGSYSFDQLRLA